VSTYIQLCSKLRQECTDSGTGPSAVTGNSGELQRYVSWIADAWTELQQAREDWLWMRRNFTVDTVSGTDAYAYTDCTDSTTATTIARFARWYEGFDATGFPYFSAYLTATGVADQQSLLSLDWDTFRRIYKFGAQTNARPAHVAVGPDLKFYLGPKPDAIYTVGGTFQLGPQILAANDDEPEMPSRFHNLIVYQAMAKYGGHRVAPEAMLRAVAEGGQLRSALELDQLPKMRYGDPLA